MVKTANLVLFVLGVSFLFSSETVEVYAFDKMPAEKISDKVTRRYVSGESEMLARWDFKKGAIIPEHQHASEQITYIVKGSVKVLISGKEYIVRSGEVMIIPPNTLHQFEALEDTIDLDIFSPPRQDWLQGTDAYLKK